MTVFAISTAKNNGELIQQAAELGYLHEDWITLDPTYGDGRFWTKWRPHSLTGSDILLDKSPVGFQVDFTSMPFGDETFDVVVFDGPYKLNGTSTGEGSSASDDSYGVGGPYRSWQAKHRLIREGLTECVRVLKPGGFLFNKCQDQVCSGQKRWQTREFADHAESLGCRLVDQLHLRGHRKQPAGRRQVHAQQNFSTLQIFAKNR